MEIFFPSCMQPCTLWCQLGDRWERARKKLCACKLKKGKKLHTKVPAGRCCVQVRISLSMKGLVHFPRRIILFANLHASSCARRCNNWARPWQSPASTFWHTWQWSVFATIHLLGDETTDDGMCSSVSSDSCCFVFIIILLPSHAHKIICCAIAPLALGWEGERECVRERAMAMKK